MPDISILMRNCNSPFRIKQKHIHSLDVSQKLMQSPPREKNTNAFFCFHLFYLLCFGAFCILCCIPSKSEQLPVKANIFLASVWKNWRETRTIIWFPPILSRKKNGFVSATKLGTKNNFFVAATKNFAAATKRFVVVTKYFCYLHFNKWFCWYHKTFSPCLREK